MRHRVMIPASLGRVALILAAVALALAGRAGAQVEPVEPVEGFLTPPTGADSGVFRDCVTALPVASGDEVVDLGCSVVDSTFLGRTGGSDSWMITYRRGATIDYPEFVDTLSIDELALVLDASGGTGFEIIWHIARDRTYELLQDVQAVERDGGLLVSYDICLNGTGGCMQEFLLGTDAWVAVTQSYLEGLAASVPGGWTLHKGRRIDLRTLRGVQPISRPEDPNCCPSGTIRFEVSLVRGDLRLVGAAVETAGSHPAEP